MRPGSRAARGAHVVAGVDRARARRGGAGATISSSTSSPTSAATSSRGSPARRGASATGPGGGGALLTDALEYAPTRTCRTTRASLVARAAGRRLPAPPSPARGSRPSSSRRPTPRHRAAARLGAARGAAGRRARERRTRVEAVAPRSLRRVARELAGARGATIVLTGSDADRAAGRRRQAQSRRRARRRRRRRAMDLPTLAALLARLDLFVTSDTGPMHLAAAVGTPVVALFGPSHPGRYGPRALAERIVRVDLPCSPCGRVRLPPERCRGHVPDCMDGITVSAVAARGQRAARRRAPGGRPRRDRPDMQRDAHLGDAAGPGAPHGDRGLRSRPISARPRASRPTRGSSACASCRTTARRCASASRTAATRSGGSRSCICTRCAGSTRPWRSRWRSRRSRARAAPARLRHRRADDRVVRDTARRVRARARDLPVECDGAGTRAGRPRARQLPHRPHRAALAAAAGCAPSCRARRASPRSSTRRSGASRPTKTAGAGELHRPGARGARRQRLGPNGLRYVGVGPRQNFRARRWWDPVTTIGQPASARDADRAALASASISRTRSRCGASATSSRRPSRPASGVRAAGDVPRLRSLAGAPARARGRRAAAVAVVRARDGRSRRGARRARAGRRPHLRGSRRLGTRARPRSAAPRHAVGRPAARLHLSPLAELPARARRDGAGRATIAAFPRPTRTLLFDGYAAAVLERRATFRRRAWSSPAARGSTRSHGGVAQVTDERSRRDSRLACGQGRSARGRARGEVQRGARASAGARRRAVATRPGVRLVVKTHPAETPELYAAPFAGLPNVTIAPADRGPRARCSRSADGIVTVNSTVAHRRARRSASRRS